MKYPPQTVAFQPPPNLISNPHQAETIVNLRKTQGKEMLSTLSAMSTQEATECKTHADASTQALRTYYQQEGASSYNLNEVLDALVPLTDRSQKTVHAEQQKRFLELSNRPTIALYMGFPEQLIPAEIKNQTSAFFTPQGKESIQTHTGGVKEFKRQTFRQQEGDPIRAPGHPQ